MHFLVSQSTINDILAMILGQILVEIEFLLIVVLLCVRMSVPLHCFKLDSSLASI